MAENEKQTNRGGLFGPPRNDEQQDPGSPNRQESVDSLEGSLARLEAVIENVERDARLASVLRAAPMGIGLVVNRVLLEVNDWFCDMVGYRREELIGRNSRMLYPTQEEWEYVGRENYGQIDLRSKGMLETRWKRKNGEVIDILLSSTLLDPENPSRGVTFTALDITARKKAENELRNIFSLSLDMICIADLRTDRFIKINPAFERILGYGEQELLNRPFMEFVHPDDLKGAREILEDKLHRGKRVVHFANRFRCKDGSYRWLDWTAHPQPEQGLTYGIARDITERKRATDMLQRQGQQLRESERKLRTLMRNLPGIAYRCANEPDWPFEFVSEGSLALTGYEPREITTGGIVTYGELIHPDDRQRVWDTVQEAGSRNAPFEMEYRILARDGCEKWVFERGRAVPSDTGQLPVLEGFITDITQRKHAEMAMQESEERYRILLDHGFDGIFVHENFHVVQVNDRLAEMTGYAPSELVDWNMLKLFTPDSQERIRRYVENGASGYYELELRHRDGYILQVESFGAPCIFQGRDAQIVAVRDIPERKRAAQTLAEKEYLLSESQRMGRIGSWSVDLATNVLTWTQETYRLYGVSPETFVPSAVTFPDLVHPDDREKLRESIRAMLAGEHPNAMEFRVVLPDGSIRVLSGQGELIFDGFHEPRRLVGTVQDVTERRRAEETLKASEARFRSIVNSSPSGIHLYELKDDGRLVFVGANPAADEILGVGHAQLAGKTIEEAFPGLDRTDVPARYREVARRGVRWRTEQIRYDEGRIRGAFDVVAFQTEPGKMVAMFNDITERKRAEEALMRLNEHLETLVAERTEDLTRTVTRLRQLTWELSQTEDRERKRIADILHDDVQQILAAARFHLNLLSIGPRSAEESHELLEQIKQMLKEAIEKARSLSHELSPVLYQVDLTETLKWLARHMHEKHGLTIRVEARNPVELSSECVKALLYKVSQELLFNVVKHSGVKEALIRVRRMGRYICLVVIDRGRGFKTQELEKTPGFGLLGIRERIQLLGGRMKIKSKPGMGCRLLIAIPDEGPTPAATQVG
jgi:PAS domain S-box-containing protein